MSVAVHIQKGAQWWRQDIRALEQTVWVESLGPEGQPVGAVQSCGLPWAMKLAMTGTSSWPGWAQAVQVVQARPGVLVAIPVGSHKVRFNGGPATRLPHEFDSWVMIETQGMRVRVSCDGVARAGAGSEGGAVNMATASRLFVAGWRPAMLLAVLGLAFAAKALSEWLATTDQTSYWLTVQHQREVLTDVLMWWTGWCALSRVLAGQLRWLDHARIVACAALAFGVSKLLVPAAFAAANLPFPSLLDECGWMFFATAAGWAHVSSMPVGALRRKVLRLAVVAALCVGVAQPASTYFNGNQRPPSLGSMLPIGFNLGEFETVDQALARVTATRPDVEALRKVPLK